MEVEKNPKLQIACNTPVTEGMVVHTKSDKAEDGRRAVLEFLLANHPLDCPVCDQSGECELQNFYMNFGLYDPRFREQKVKKKKAVAVGPHVMLDQERCILCSRCVRFTDEITKTGEFGIFNRGDRAELGLYPGQELNNPYSGNVIDVCPVGALTEQDFRFKARVWYLSSAPTVCNGCAQGCNIDVHYVLDRPHLNDGARVLRLKPRYNPDVNQWWMCDEGRFGFHWIDRGRLTTGPPSRRRVHLGEGHRRHRCGARDSSADGSRLAARCHRLFGAHQRGAVPHQGNLPERTGRQVTAAVPAPPGYSDDFLIKADKNPNTRGATAAGTGRPGRTACRQHHRRRASRTHRRAVGLRARPGGARSATRSSKRCRARVDLLIFSGTNENRTAAAAHWVLPTAAYLEKDGTLRQLPRPGPAHRPRLPAAGRLAGRLDAAAGHRATARSPARLAHSSGDLPGDGEDRRCVRGPDLRGDRISGSQLILPMMPLGRCTMIESAIKLALAASCSSVS